jgi:GNAT superfamily N-acetyltransferase
MTALQISFEPFNDTPRQYVVNGVDNHNIAATGESEYFPVNYYLKSDSGDVQGGLLAGIWGKWLHIKFVWVASAARGQGFASAMVAKAEDYAREKGCIGAHLETFSFQARPLYEKLGYEVFGTLDDCPPGHSFFFLRKHLK